MTATDGRIDVQRLIGVVAERHGILLKPDDAAFALVTLNELVLRGAAAELMENVHCALADHEAAASRLQTRAGGMLAAEVREAASEIRRELQSDMVAAGKDARQLVMDVHQSHSVAARNKWIAVGVTAALILFLFGFLAGRMQ